MRQIYARYLTHMCSWRSQLFICLFFCFCFCSASFWRDFLFFPGRTKRRLARHYQKGFLLSKFSWSANCWRNPGFGLIGLDCRIVCRASADDMPFFIMRYAATTVAERDQPITQLTTVKITTNIRAFELES